MIVLLVPLVALLGAILWVTVTSRPAKPMEVAESVEAHHRVLAALAPRDRTS